MPTNNPASYIEVEGSVCACGRDPYFPAWPDVLQLNAFSAWATQEVIETVTSIAAQCDGVPLRYGDASTESDLRTHMGRSCRATAANRVLVVKSSLR